MNREAVGRWTLIMGLGAVIGGGVCMAWMRHAGAVGIPTPPTLYYSGTLAESGMPVTGVKQIAISLWTAETDGTRVCEANDAAAAVQGGRFRIALTNDCLMGVRNNPDLWAQATVDGTTFPRRKLGAVPYAVEAERAASVTGPAAQQMVPSGAVMAFDLDACPAGWTELTAARGRTVVGVNPAATGGLSAHARGATGGAERITLAEAQLPAHTHGVDDPGHRHASELGTFIQGGVGNCPVNIAQTGRSFECGTHTASSTTGVKIGATGQAAPIPSLPPFVALLYCRKT